MGCTQTDINIPAIKKEGQNLKKLFSAKQTWYINLEKDTLPQNIMFCFFFTFLEFRLYSNSDGRNTLSTQATTGN